MVYKREFTDEEIKCIEYFVEDLTKWIDAAIDGKLASCRKRIVKSEIEKAMTEEAKPLGTPKEIVSNFIGSKEFKCRKERDLEQIKEESNGQSLTASVRIRS